jgi:hypothetical protein
MTQVLGHRVDRVIVKLWVRSAHVFDHKEGLKAWRPRACRIKEHGLQGYIGLFYLEGALDAHLHGAR